MSFLHENTLSPPEPTAIEIVFLLKSKGELESNEIKLPVVPALFLKKLLVNVTVPDSSHSLYL